MSTKQKMVTDGQLEILSLALAVVRRKHHQHLSRKEAVEVATTQMTEALEALRICGYSVVPAGTIPNPSVHITQRAVELLQSQGYAIFPAELIPAIRKALEKLL
jgi:hypothetical protein